MATYTALCGDDSLEYTLAYSVNVATGEYVVQVVSVKLLKGNANNYKFITENKSYIHIDANCSLTHIVLCIEIGVYLLFFVIYFIIAKKRKTNNVSVIVTFVYGGSVGITSILGYCLTCKLLIAFGFVLLLLAAIILIFGKNKSERIKQFDSSINGMVVQNAMIQKRMSQQNVTVNGNSNINRPMQSGNVSQTQNQNISPRRKIKKNQLGLQMPNGNLNQSNQIVSPRPMQNGNPNMQQGMNNGITNQMSSQQPNVTLNGLRPDMPQQNGVSNTNINLNNNQMPNRNISPMPNQMGQVMQNQPRPQMPNGNLNQVSQNASSRQIPNGNPNMPKGMNNGTTNNNGDKK